MDHPELRTDNRQPNPQDTDLHSSMKSHQDVVNFQGKPRPIARTRHLQSITEALERKPVVGLIGARQVGKTTLARQLAEGSGSATFFDLENPAHLAQLADPILALESLRGLVVLDEIQRVPDLFPVLRLCVPGVSSVLMLTSAWT